MQQNLREENQSFMEFLLRSESLNFSVTVSARVSGVSNATCQFYTITAHVIPSITFLLVSYFAFSKIGKQ